MPMQQADIAAKLQWDALIALFQAESVPGKRLDGVNYVGRSYSLWTQKPPAIGVQLKTGRIAPYANQTRELTTTFWVIMGAQSTGATAEVNMQATTPANLEDAMNILQKYVSDGNGNGIIPVLNDTANYTLGGNAIRMMLGEFAYDWEVGPGSNPQIWAYCQFVLTVVQRVFI